MFRNLLTLITLFGWTVLTAQPALLPHIGQSEPPDLSEPVCDIPVYTGGMDQSGYQEDDLVHDFTLYTLDGDSVRLSSELAKGKPVLLVGANYTCPVWRGKIDALNEMAVVYNDLVSIFVIYTVEAHPAIDISPYSGQVWTTSANETSGILYEQPETYGERLAIVSDMLDSLEITPPILVDGPCNPWWSHYGPAPNNAYLIRTDGTVAAKHGWFHRPPDNMWCDIDNLLGMDSGHCTQNGDNGTFFLTLDDPDSVAYGMPGQTLALHSTIKNLSATDNVHIRIKKIKVTTPKTWETALCADICYASDVEETDIVVGPGESQPFIFYFYTGTEPDSGYARVRFQNMTNNQNRVFQQYYGVTSSTTSADSNPENHALALFPNPAQQDLTVETSDYWIGGTWQILDPLGRLKLHGILIIPTQQIELTDLYPGTYIFQWRHPEGGSVESRVVLVK